MTFPYGQTVTLIRRAVNGTDSFGNDTYGETRADIFPCVVQPAGTSEDVQWTDAVTTDLAIFMPYGTNVAAVDAVEYNGIQYEVQGEVSTWVSPFSGHTSPIQMRVRKVTGASV